MNRRKVFVLTWIWKWNEEPSFPNFAAHVVSLSVGLSFVWLQIRRYSAFIFCPCHGCCTSLVFKVPQIGPPRAANEYDNYIYLFFDKWVLSFAFPKSFVPTMLWSPVPTDSSVFSTNLQRIAKGYFQYFKALLSSDFILLFHFTFSVKEVLPVSFWAKVHLKAR